MKVVINRCLGGFWLSAEARSWLIRNGMDEAFFEDDVKRDDPLLVQCVEELGPIAGNSGCDLVIVQIPDDVEWCMERRDGVEWVAEKHRIWDGED